MCYWQKRGVAVSETAFLCYSDILLTNFDFTLTFSHNAAQSLMYRSFDGREGNPLTLTLPSHFGSHFHRDMMWRHKAKKVRETWGRTVYPHVPSALCTSAFARGDGTKGGIFSNSSFFRVQDISNLLLVRRIRTQSPKASDSQSVGTD